MQGRHQQIQLEKLCSKGTGVVFTRRQSMWYSPVVLRDSKGMRTALKYRSSQGQRRSSNCQVLVLTSAGWRLYRVSLAEFCGSGNLV